MSSDLDDWAEEELPVIGPDGEEIPVAREGVSRRRRPRQPRHTGASARRSTALVKRPEAGEARRSALRDATGQAAPAEDEFRRLVADKDHAGASRALGGTGTHSGTGFSPADYPRYD